MFKTSALLAASLALAAPLAAPPAAHAASAPKTVTYTITMESFCDVLVLSVTSGFITGTDTGCSGVYPSTPYFVGTTAKISSMVAPGGSVLSVASDFGITANNVQVEMNLGTGNAVFYGNDSGSLFSNASAFTYTKGKETRGAPKSNAGKPSFMAAILARAGK